jgi:hypothetical protein
VFLLSSLSPLKGVGIEGPAPLPHSQVLPKRCQLNTESRERENIRKVQKLTTKVNCQPMILARQFRYEGVIAAEGSRGVSE